MSFIDNPLYDITALQPGQGAELANEDLASEFGNEDQGEGNVQFDEDGGATVNLGGEAGAASPEKGFYDNLVDMVTPAEADEAQDYVLSSEEVDRNSRKDWEEAYIKGLDYLGIKNEDRTQPFKGASGVVHPLLLESAGQFQAGAYKELIPANGPAETKILGKETPELQKKAQRVKNYINYKIMFEMEEFEVEYDQMLFVLSLAGSIFKKVYRDPDLGRAVSDVCYCEDVLVPYTAKTLRRAERVTHITQMSVNELRRLQLTGFYTADPLPDPGVLSPSQVKEKYDKLEGRDPSYTTLKNDGVYTLLECHCRWQFESLNDPYPVPYIVTVVKETGKIIGLRRNWKEGDQSYRPRQFFVHYKFTPGLGFYGFGLIHMLGNLSKAATANLRQLIDSGTFANMQGGFKARGLRVQNEQENIAPGEWRDVDVPGNSIREALLPIPYKEPSPTLFQLLGFLVQAAEKFIGTQELGIADGNKETPVGTTVALLERGTKIMSAVHKRLHGALKVELKLLAALFGEEATAYPYEVEGAAPEVFAEDFGPQVDVVPVSDPNIFSMAQRVVLAQEQLKLAMSAPEMHNTYEAFRRMYAALGVQNIDDILKPPPQPLPENPAMENARAPLLAVSGGAPLKAFPDQDHSAHIAAHMAFAKSPLVKNAMPVYGILYAHVMDHMSLQAESDAREQLGMPPLQPPTPEQPIDPTSMNPQLQVLIAQNLAKMLVQFSEIEPQFVDGGGDDPLLAAKNKEIEVRKQDNERKAQIDLFKTKVQDENEADKLRVQQEIAAQKIQADKERDARKAQIDAAKAKQDMALKQQDHHLNMQMKHDQHRMNQSHAAESHEMQSEFSKQKTEIELERAKKMSAVKPKAESKKPTKKE